MDEETSHAGQSLGRCLMISAGPGEGKSAVLNALRANEPPGRSISIAMEGNSEALMEALEKEVIEPLFLQP